MPGAGKSTLAQALAFDESILKHFTGGILWASLGPGGEAADVLNLWADAFEIDLRSARDTDQRGQRLGGYIQRALEGRRVLLVLDDIWHLDQVMPFLYFTAPGSVLLLTTRDEQLARRFGTTGTTHVVELQSAEGVQLLRELAPDAWAVDPGAFEGLAAAVGGLPLARFRAAWSLRSQTGRLGGGGGQRCMAMQYA